MINILFSKDIIYQYLWLFLATHATVCTLQPHTSVCRLIEMYGSDALGVHLLNHCSIAPSLGNSIEVPSLTNNTSFSIVIALLWSGGTLFISVTVVHCSNSIFLTEHKWHTFSCCQTRHICSTPSDHSNTQRWVSKCAAAMFIFISSWLCLSCVCDYSQTARWACSFQNTS